MKKLLSTILSGVMMVSLLAGCGNSGSGTNTGSSTNPGASTSNSQAAGNATTILQLGHVNPSTDTDNLQYTCLAFAKKLEDLSGGTIQVKISGDSQLGTDREMIEGMQMGTVDMVLCMNSSLGAFISKFQVFDLPYMFENRNQVYGVFDDNELMGPLKEQLYNETGIVMLGMVDNGFRNCLNNIKPINNIDDIKGLKLRLPENAVWSACFTAFGASPTTMAFSEVYTACQQGTVDGFELPIASTYSGSYWEVCKYYSLTEHLFTALDLCMSGMTWDSFTEEQQRWIQESADYAVAQNRDYIQQVEDGWLTEIGEHMEVNTCADKSALISAAQGVYADYADEIGQELLESVMDKITSIQ